tara:strand:+ start:358 stop:549 length:192 start_codon:yes stop_codon:yes gene_type:complete
MKANFKINEDDEETKNDEGSIKGKNDTSNEEFEKYIKNVGAAGSFMVFRNFKKKQDELGLDEI